MAVIVPPAFDGSLPGSHSYLGLTDEHALNFPPYTLLPSKSKIECPLLASKFCLFPGEIFPFFSDDGDAINVIEQVRASENGFCFHLSHKDENDENCYGVLLQLTHYRTEDDNVIAKFKALQIFIFREIRLGTYSVEVFLFNLKVVGEAVKEDICHLTREACDPNWLYQKSLTFEIPRLFLRHLRYNNWNTIKAGILTYYLAIGMDEAFAKEKLEEDPAFVSYYLISNVPMTLKEKQDLFLESVESRIYYCLENLLHRFVSITCNGHNCLLIKPEDIKFISHAGVCQLFVNPAGFYFNCITVESRQIVTGTEENTWFPKYQWGYLMCNCNLHNGWGYFTFECVPSTFACIHLENASFNRLPVMNLSEYPPFRDRERRENEWNIRPAW